MRPVPLALLTLLAGTTDAAAAAPPTELVCTLAGPGLIHIDGLIDDWANLPEVTRADADPRDAAVAVRCAYDKTTLYLLVNVTDDRLIRTKQKTRDEDHLVLGFGAQAFEIYPASAEQGAKLAFGWVGRGAASLPRVSVADSLQKRGWSVELAAPLRGLPGLLRGAPSLPLTVELYDADSLTARHIESVVTTGELALTFEEAAATLKSFLEGAKVHRGDIVLDQTAELDGQDAPQRVVVAGRVVGLLGDGYSYLELPVESARDVLSVQLVDLGGAGRASLVVRTVERGNGGSREVLSVWNTRNGQWNRLFAHEIAKVVGARHVTDTWELVPRGKGRKGVDLVIKPGEAVGFTAETWNETPASDMVPILLPWAGKPQEIWRFDGGMVSGG
jgi:hypothetical protein